MDIIYHLIGPHTFLPVETLRIHGVCRVEASQSLTVLHKMNEAAAVSAPAPAAAASFSVSLFECVFAAVCVCVLAVTILHFMSNAHAFNIDRRRQCSSNSSK